MIDKLKIRALRETGLSYPKIGKQLGCSASYCWQVVNDPSNQDQEQRLTGPGVDLITERYTTLSDTVVTQDTALSISAVFCAVRTIAEAVSSLPLILYRRVGQGKERAQTHPLYQLLKTDPNPEQSAADFWCNAVASCLLHGNFFAEIERAKSGRPTGLWALHPERVIIRRNPAPPFNLYYQVMPLRNFPLDPSIDYRLAEITILPPENIYHVKGLGNGYQGYSVLRLARESLGVSHSLDEFAGSYFGNAVRPSGAITTQRKLSPEARENLRKSTHAEYGGKRKAAKLMILEEGLSFQPFSLSGDDMQFLQHRQFSTQEIARWFNIPITKLHDLGRATWSNIETENLNFLTDTLRPWLIKIEQEISKKLLLANEKSQYFAEHLVDAILRADSQTRTQVFAQRFMNGECTLNEWRRAENKNPIANGDVHFVPANLMPLNLLIEKLTILNDQLEDTEQDESPPDQAQDQAEDTSDDQDQDQDTNGNQSAGGTTGTEGTDD